MKIKMTRTVTVMTIILYVLLMGGVIYGMWLVGRKINYAWSYEDQVKETIKATIKPECLKP